MGTTSGPSSFYVDDLVLGKFELGDRNIHFRGYAGEGIAGYVFRVRIGGKQYALKMVSWSMKVDDMSFTRGVQFKFHHPDPIPTRHGWAPGNSLYDPFIVECRANSAIIAHGWNGKFSPFCHGWLEVPLDAEKSLDRMYRLAGFSWDRSANAPDQKVRAILFDFLDGKTIAQIRLSADIANQCRTIVNSLHEISIAHNDMQASHFLVQAQPGEERVFIIDFSVSFTLPYSAISMKKWKEAVQRDTDDLELGLYTLSQLPINQGLTGIADMAVLSDRSAESLTTLCAKLGRPGGRWAPPGEIPSWYKLCRQSGVNSSIQT